MMNKEHQYKTSLVWTGNKGMGTINYRAYERNYTITVDGKPALLGSSDPSFLGDRTKYNPEELLVASLSSCHLLWYLHLCADAGITVTDYQDKAIGTMQELENGSGHFIEVMLQPIVTITDASLITLANELHARANKMCFIANSCNFPVKHKPTCLVADK